MRISWTIATREKKDNSTKNIPFPFFPFFPFFLLLKKLA